MNTIIEKAREIPVIGEFDVIVAGGGISGCVAAIAAAREGSRTLLVERYGYLGGLVTAWPVPVLFQYGSEKRPLVKGIGKEIVDRCSEIGRWRPEGEAEILDQYTGYFYGTDYTDGVLDYELLKLVLLQMLTESRVEVLLHSFIINAITEEDRLKGIIIENKSGRQAVLSKAVIDCTGDGDVAFLAGAECMMPTGKGGAIDFYDPDDCSNGSDNSTFVSIGVIFSGIDKERVLNFENNNPEEYEKIINEFIKIGGKKYFGFHTEATMAFHQKCNILDAKQLTNVEIMSAKNILECMMFAKRNIPGYENINVKRVSAQTGIRESRRVKGLYILSKEDAERGLEYDDIICRFNYKNKYIMGIPYRSIVPEKIKGLIIGCRSFSVDRELFEFIRLIGTSMAIGQAAGIAASVSCSKNIDFCDINYDDIKKLLVKQNVYLDRYKPDPKYKFSGH